MSKQELDLGKPVELPGGEELVPADLGPIDSLSDFGRYSQARRIGDILIKQDGRRHDNRTGEGAKPSFRQTHRGFYLEQYYGSPSRLWTPWGEFHILGSGFSWTESDREVVLRQLGATLHRPAVNSEGEMGGTVGPIYAVHKIDGFALPDPVERPWSQYVPYEEATKAWDSLTKQYREQLRGPKTSKKSKR